MKKIICLTLTALMLLSISVSATKVYDYSGDIPKGDVADFYAYPIAQNATRYSPWFVQWARQTEAEYKTGVRAGDGNQMIMSIAGSPVNPDHLLFGVDTSGIWRSTDGGINWATTGENNNNWCVSDIVWSPNDENVAFCVQTGSRTYISAVTKAFNSKLDGIYKTTDAGHTWKLVLAKNVISRAASNGMIKYDKHGNFYALTSEGLYVSKDDGETFKLIDKDFLPENSEVYSLHLFENENKKMLVCAMGGLYYTESGGVFWKLLNPDVEGVESCTSVTIDPFDENHWFACFQGTQRHTLFQTYNRGASWEKVEYPVGASGNSTTQIVRYTVTDEGVPRLILVYANYAKVFKYSDNHGKTWNNPTIHGRELVYNNTGSGYACEGLYIDEANPVAICQGLFHHFFIFVKFAEYPYVSFV